MAIMYLSKENFTCPIVQISLYLSVLNRLHFRKQYETKPLNSVDSDQLASEESGSGSTLFSMQHVNS